MPFGILRDRPLGSKPVRWECLNKMNTKTKRITLWLFCFLGTVCVAGTIWLHVLRANKELAANKVLLAAALQGSLPHVQKALRDGADVDARDPEGRTPLMCAAEKGNVRIAQVLLAHGASVNARDYAQTTVLSLAAGNGSEDVVTLLLKNGADLTDESVQQALAFASDYPHIVARLKEAQARQRKPTNRS